MPTTEQGSNPGRCDPKASARSHSLTPLFSRSVLTLKFLFRAVRVDTPVTSDTPKMRGEQVILPRPPPYLVACSHLPSTLQRTRTRCVGEGEGVVRTRGGGVRTGSPSFAQQRAPAGCAPGGPPLAVQCGRLPGLSGPPPARWDLHPSTTLPPRPPPPLMWIAEPPPAPSCVPPDRFCLDLEQPFRKCKSDHVAHMEEGPRPLPGPITAPGI